MPFASSLRRFDNSPPFSVSCSFPPSQAADRTEELLQAHKEGLLKVAERLLSKEKISKDDMIDLLGERPWKERRSYRDLAYEDEKKVHEIEEKEKEEEQKKEASA